VGNGTALFILLETFNFDLAFVAVILFFTLIQSIFFNVLFYVFKSSNSYEALFLSKLNAEHSFAKK